LDDGLWATTLGIYYTNTSPVSTIIWLKFATKLCQGWEAYNETQRTTLD